MMWMLILVFVHVCWCSPDTRGKIGDLCAFPCKFQGRTYMRYEDDNGNRAIFGEDPTIATAVNNGSVLFVAECFKQVGQFKVVRHKMSGNDTYSKYICYIDTDFDESGDIIVRYRNKPKIFKDDPSFCDVCDGSGFKPFVIKDESLGNKCKDVTVPELGCNLPSVCQEAKEWQKQCPGSNEFDDGLCCEEYVDNKGKKRKRKCTTERKK